jgi:hypothetical protein
MPTSKYYKKIDSFYKNAKNDIEKKLNIINEYSYNFTKENDRHVVEISHNDKIKLKAEYNTIGIYNIPLSFWYWSWSLPFVNKELLDKAEKIKSFSQKLEKEKDFDKFTPEELEELHFITSNNNFYTTSENINRIIRFAMYVTNSIWYFPVKHSEQRSEKNNNQMEIIEYILITKVLQFN